MRDKTDFNILLNFSKGKYSYNDYLKVKKWFEEKEKDRDIEQKLVAQWQEFIDENKSSNESLHHIFEKIQYKILLEEEKKVKKNVIWNFYRQAAAILIIPVLAFSVWYNISLSHKISQPVISQTKLTAQSWVEINAPEGARVEFFLPDSSRGWLNSGSKLKYPSVFDNHRKVELTGEAYFEVKHLDQSDFVVSVADMNIKVLGTKFNVTAYLNDSFTDVVLKEGKVEVDGKAGVFNHTLLPNERIKFNREAKTLNLTNVDADRYIAWKEGYLVIDNESLGQVISRIERWYNCKINIKDEELKKYRFKATFKDEPLEEVLKLIAITTPIKYDIKKREVRADGALKKKEVTIRLR